MDNEHSSVHLQMQESIRDIGCRDLQPIVKHNQQAHQAILLPLERGREMRDGCDPCSGGQIWPPYRLNFPKKRPGPPLARPPF